MTTIPGARAVLTSGLLLITVGRVALAQHPARASAATDSITPAQIALGDSVFHGKAGGGTCAVCHGQDAKGTTGLAPDLTDAKWLNGDGSYAFIVGIVQKGVPNPKESPAPMPPLGGASLTPDQVRAVAAYVYSLAKHANAPRGP
ncbi:MAG TPA: c-type cytochrome [Gemmatimonadales bacterium]|nr:c-type cytochrome [Gemmatimonadales bacterium]